MIVRGLRNQLKSDGMMKEGGYVIQTKDMEEQLDDDEEARCAEPEAIDGEFDDILEELAKDGDEAEDWKFAVRAPKRDLKAEAISTEHMLCHKPHNPILQGVRSSPWQSTCA